MVPYSKKALPVVSVFGEGQVASCLMTALPLQTPLHIVDGFVMSSWIHLSMGKK